MAKNEGFVYVKEPGPVPKFNDCFELRSMDMPEVKEGMVLGKVLMTSSAPHLWAFLKLPGNDVGAEAVGLKRTTLGEVVPSEVIAEVVESRSPKFKVGDKVSSFFPLQRYVAWHGKPEAGSFAPVKLLPGQAPEAALSMGSMLTAQIVVSNHPCGWVEEPWSLGGCFGFVFKLLRRKAQKTVLVTSAAGSVGITACQLYKNRGCKVIGVTSTKAKADRVKELGIDHVIAYKEEDMDTRLGEVAPEGIDVFFDNVGSLQLDTGSKHMKVGGKIVQVGAASEIPNYATGEITGWKQYIRLASRELQVGGFLLTNHFKEIPVAALKILLAQKRGKLKTMETVVHGGLDKFAECADSTFDGRGFGKSVLVLDQ